MRTNLLRSILTAGFAVAATAAALAQQQQPPQPPPIIPGVAPPSAPSNPAARPSMFPGQAFPSAQTAPAAAPATQPAAQPATQPAPQPVVPGQAPASAPPTPAAPAAAPPPATVPAQAPAAASGGFDAYIPNGSLTDFIDLVAKRVGFSYILDPAVGSKGSVSLVTYGESRPTDMMTLLQTVLRVNGAAIVKVGDLYRIVPINKISALPLDPMVNVDQKTLPQDERMILDLIFLKYSTAKEIESLISPFLGEGASHSTYDAANLLILQDNARNMKRTLQLIEMFDSESFAGQRVKLFDVTNSRPADLVKELDTVFKAYAFSDKASAVKFIPVDRINTIIAVAPNPGIFPQVQSWIEKLDIAVKTQAGEVSTYVYRLKYQRAATIAMAITALYTGNTTALMQLAYMANSNSAGNGNGGYGGMNYNGQGMGGGGIGSMGGGYNMNGGNGMSGYGNSGYGQNTGGMIAPINTPQAGSSVPTPASGPNTLDLTGLSLGAAGTGAGQNGGQRIPHIIPNPFDNTLLIQGTPQEWAQINNLLRQLDVAPRQVLIEMKIYELDLTGAFNEGITAYMEQAGANGTGLGRALSVATGSSGLGLSLGTLVGSTREILGVCRRRRRAARRA